MKVYIHLFGIKVEGKTTFSVLTYKITLRIYKALFLWELPSSLDDQVERRERKKVDSKENVRQRTFQIENPRSDPADRKLLLFRKYYF